MKKGIVALLVILALVVLISPGIVGRLAEKSVEDQMQWAADENQEIVITSERFDRSWFSSEGQHRIELGDTDAGARVRAELGFGAGEATPAILIDTRIDHGLIPVSSMSRDEGSLAPGLGSAVSTISIESGDGELVQLPGTIYSNVGLTGELTSRYKLQPGSMGNASWGNVNIEGTVDARNRDSQFTGTIESFVFSEKGDDMRIAGIDIDGDLSMTEYGYTIGDLKMSVASLSVAGNGDNGDKNVTMGPINIDATSKLNGDRVDSDVAMDMVMNDMGILGVGDVSWALDMSLDGVDAVSLGAVTDGIDNMPDTQDPTQAFAGIEGDLMDMFASGFQLHLNKFDVTLPQGTLMTKFNFDIPESDRDSFVWTSVLLGLQADADVRIPEGLFDFITSMVPDANAAVAMGILKKSNGIYVMEADYKRGLLTVNGAPMPIPLPGFQ